MKPDHLTLPKRMLNDTQKNLLHKELESATTSASFINRLNYLKFRFFPRGPCPVTRIDNSKPPLPLLAGRSVEVFTS